jgi:hypothetical protein
VSYILTQVQKQVDGREQEVLVACGGRALRDSETRWPPIHTEALAALLGVIAYKHFVGRKVTVRTDSLTVRFIKDLRKSKHNRLFRWGLFIDTVPNLTFKHVPGKLNVVADLLSRRPYEEPQPPSKEEAKLLNEMMVCSLTRSIGLDNFPHLGDEDEHDWLWFRANFDNEENASPQLDTILDGEEYEALSRVPKPCDQSDNFYFSGDHLDCDVQSECCSECCIGFGCPCEPVDVFTGKDPRASQLTEMNTLSSPAECQQTISRTLSIPDLQNVSQFRWM